MDLDASPERYLPNKEEVNKDLFHLFLAVKIRQAIQTEALPLCEAVETVSIPYDEQLSQPSIKVTHK
ncbi:hypothetical protein DSO57_1035283, partial [Entomophthora muscae]